MEEIKAIPQDETLERNVLGSILYDSECYTRIRAFLNDSLFYSNKTKLIYKAIESLATDNEPIDYLTVSNRLLSNKDAKKVFGSEELVRYEIAELSKDVDSVILYHVEAHIKILSSYSQSRDLIFLASKISNSAFDSTMSQDDLIADYREKLDEIGSKLDELSKIIGSPTKEEWKRIQQGIPNGINTRYVFSNGDRKYNIPATTETPLILPIGALTFICGATSHGKSTFLRNIALDIARDESKGKVLYFTFEESELAISNQFVNIILGEDLNVIEDRKTIQTRITNISAISKYWNLELISHFEDVEYINGEIAYAKIDKAVKEFERIYCKNEDGHDAKLIIINKDIQASKLASLVKTYYKRETRKGGKVSAIFIDYIQLLTEATDTKNASKSVELTAVCDRLRSFSIETQLPVICAAQLRRETESPLDLCNQNISDASSIEKAANLIVCIWNSNFEARNRSYYGISTTGEYKESNELGKVLRDRGFYAGGISKYNSISKIQNIPSTEETRKTKIYAKITKWRGNEVNLDAIFEYRGNLGIVVPNETNQIPTVNKQKYNGF